MTLSIRIICQTDPLVQAETINRLLKKQSRAKGKRNALSTAEDRPTPLNSTVNNVADLDADENGDTIMVPEPIIPTMYRWISSAKPITPGPKSGNKNETDTRVMTLSFSVPKYVLPQAQTPDPAAMEVDKLPAAPTPTVTPIRTIPQCDIHGCGEKRKYRLVKDWQKGACGMAHLRELEDAFIAGKIH